MTAVSIRKIVTGIGITLLTMVSLLIFAPGAAWASVIPNVLVNTYSSNFVSDSRFASNSVDGVDPSSNTDNWLTNGTPTGSITWSLNGRQTLNTIDVYNYRDFGPGGETDRGVDSVVVSVSNDWGQTYTTLQSDTLSQAPATGTNPAQTLNVGSVTATNIRFDVSNFDNANGAFVGLNEVTFNGTPAKHTTLVPLTFMNASSEFSGRGGAKAVDGIIDTTDGTDGMWLSNLGVPTPTLTLGLGDGTTPLVLDHLNIWNYNETGETSRGLNTIEIRLFDGATDLGLAVNDADSSTMFTLNEAMGQLTPTMDTLGLRNAPAATSFEIITIDNSNGDGSAGGLTEVQAFELVPEPASLGLLAAGGLMLLRRRRVM